MSLFDTFKVAASAMRAQTQRLNTVASNMANTGTVASSEADVYQAKRVVFEALLENRGGLNKAKSAAVVSAKEIINDETPARKVYSPGHPMADQEGYIYMPDINPASEMVDMLSASRNYQTNAEVMNTSKSLMMKTLNIGN